MTQLDYTIFLLTAFGIVYGVVGSVLLMPLRLALATRSVWLEALLYCPYCVGFWAGVLLRATWFAQLQSLTDVIECVPCGFLVVGAIALARAAWPSFLESRFESERSIIEELRGNGVPAEPVAQSDDAEEDRHG